MHKGLVLFFLIFFFTFSFVSGQPPFQQEEGSLEGLTLRFPPVQSAEINTTVTAHMHVYNSTNGLILTNSSVNCYIHLYNSTGNHLVEQEMGFDTNEIEFHLVILGSNFSYNGYYSFIIWCNSTTAGGFVSGDLQITPNGLILTQAENDLFEGGLLLLIIFFIGSLICIYKFDHYIAKFVFYWISHLLIILIFFSAWQFAGSYAIGYTGLTGIFKVFFYFFIFAVIPMFFLSMAWVFYIHLFNEHFQKLVDKGEDTETAFKIAKKKTRGGWFSGQ